MNPTIDELNALGRIIQAIKCFRQLSPNTQRASKRSENAYLKKHLSSQDWLFWKYLQTESNGMKTFINTQVLLPDRVFSAQQFSLLLHQYRRAGFELYQSWYQTAKPANFNKADF